MFLKKTLAILALVFGGLGIVASLAGFYSVWWIGSRLEQTNEHVAVLVGDGLASLQSRVVGVQERVAESRIMAQDFAKHLEEQAKGQIQDQLIARFELEKRTDGLLKRLDTASHWLDLSAESVRILQNFFEISQSLGVTFNLPSLADLSERLASSQNTLVEAVQRLQEVRASMAADDSNPNRRARFASTALARILLAIVDVDAKLGKVADRLAESQTLTHRAKDKVNHYICLMTIVGYIVLFWMAAAQVALCCWGWKACKRSRT